MADATRSAGAAARQEACKANFAAGERIQFSLEVWTRTLATIKADGAALTLGAALAAAIDVDAHKRWNVGTILTAEIITELQAMGLKEVDIFEPL